MTAGGLGAAGLATLGAVASTSSPVSCGEAAASSKADKAKMSVYSLPLGDKFPKEIPAYIEVSKGSRNK